MGELSPQRAAEVLTDPADFDFHRHADADLLTRAWALRENVTAYDAMYVALAEALDATVPPATRRWARRRGTGRASRWSTDGSLRCKLRDGGAQVRLGRVTEADDERVTLERL